MDEVEFAESFRPAQPVSVADVLARTMAMPDREELVAAQAEKAARDEAEQRRETQAMLNRMRGDPIGNMNRCQVQVAACRDEVADLESRLSVARARLDQVAEQYLDFSRTAEEVMQASVRRSDAGSDMLAQSKAMMAELNVERMLSGPRPEPRPFARGGHAVRSEVTCADCIKVGATPEQSFLIHADPDAPFERQLTDLDDAAETVLGPAGGWRAERREGRAPMIYR